MKQFFKPARTSSSPSSELLKTFYGMKDQIVSIYGNDTLSGSFGGLTVSSDNDKLTLAFGTNEERPSRCYGAEGENDKCSKKIRWTATFTKKEVNIILNFKQLYTNTLFCDRIYTADYYLKLRNNGQITGDVETEEYNLKAHNPNDIFNRKTSNSAMTTHEQEELMDVFLDRAQKAGLSLNGSFQKPSFNS